MADYPDSIATFRTIANLPSEPYNVDNQTTLYTEDIQRLRDEIIAVQTNLGIQLERIYPVGIIIEFGDTTQTPMFRGLPGVWERHCEGRVHASLESTGVFATIGAEIGADEVTLTEEQSGLVGHNHTQNEHNHTQSQHRHLMTSVAIGGTRNYTQFGTDAGIVGNRFTNYETAGNLPSTATNNAVTGAYASEAHNNIQRSKVVVCWERTG
jgi:hypothetical protein